MGREERSDWLEARFCRLFAARDCEHWESATYLWRNYVCLSADAKPRVLLAAILASIDKQQAVPLFLRQHISEVIVVPAKKGWPPKVRRAAQLMGQGMKMTPAAEQAGLSHQLMGHWLSKDPALRRYVSKLLLFSALSSGARQGIEALPVFEK
jgi:hypothetical protein